jgi:hypothetical protein
VRLIRIGRLRVGWYVLTRVSGHPNGLLMEWAGRGHVLQTREFFRWEEVWHAIEKRCEMAGLEASAPRSRWPAERLWLLRPHLGKWRTEVWVEVRRISDGVRILNEGGDGMK